MVYGHARHGMTNMGHLNKTSTGEMCRVRSRVCILILPVICICRSADPVPNQLLMVDRNGAQHAVHPFRQNRM